MKPVDALNQLLSEFQAGLNPLNALVDLSRTYQSQGAAFAQNIAGMWGDLSTALPNFTPQQAAQSASVTVNGQQQTVVVHRHEPQDVNLHFLGENGEWIVKSLTVDGTARKQTATLIGTEIAATLGDDD